MTYMCDCDANMTGYLSLQYFYGSMYGGSGIKNHLTAHSVIPVSAKQGREEPGPLRLTRRWHLVRNPH